jgi:hypothetical protein
VCFTKQVSLQLLGKSAFFGQGACVCVSISVGIQVVCVCVCVCVCVSKNVWAKMNVGERRYWFTLHYAVLHNTTLDYAVLHYTTLHRTRLDYTVLHYTTSHCTTLDYAVLHYTTSHCTTLHTHTHPVNRHACSSISRCNFYTCSPTARSLMVAVNCSVMWCSVEWCGMI